MVVMLATGSIMHWFDPFPNDWRTGATFVHDWFAIALWLVVIGHIWLAFGDRDALHGMTRGSVTAKWAQLHRPRWYDEITGTTTDAAPADPGARSETLAGSAPGDR
jgi:formate dehydrogenase subunit gamma